MMAMAIRLVVLAIVFAVACTELASAHDIWITTTKGGKLSRAIVNYGHPFDRPPTYAEKVLDLVAISADGERSLLPGLSPARWHGAPVVESRPFADHGHTLLATRYDNGYWVKTAAGLYRNVSRRLVPDALDSLWSVKFAKTLTGSGGPWTRVVGHELELVPLADPGEIKAGESLRVRVLFQGKPLTKAQVERGDGVTPVKEADIPRFTTDGEGIATIPIVKRGPVLLAIDHRVTPSATPELAAADLYNATLWFSVVPKQSR
jgi:uncharacterized GH25 family protein